MNKCYAALRWAIAFVVAIQTAAAANVTAPDKSWFADDPAMATRPAEHEGMARTSTYITMRDGVRIAVDVWLPTGLAPGTKLPTIIEQTRYYRSAQIKSDPNGECRPPAKATINLFVTHGYAYVVVDVRGTGASFGTRTSEYSDEEVKDGAEIVDWIIKQSWSDGQIGAMGQSYTGTTAELLLRNHHPAVKAALPTFAGYDFYTEITYPGGIQSSFGAYWSDLIRGLDIAQLPESSPIHSVCAVDDDKDKSLMRAAIAEHTGNFQMSELLKVVSFRDDRYGKLTGDASSLFRYQKSIDAAKRPIYGITGWYDSGYGLAALRRFTNTKAPGQRVLIGPWNHGGRYFYGPGFHVATPSSFDMANEKLRFFDFILKKIDRGFSSAPPIRYFTTGINRWQSATEWPLRESRLQSWYLTEGGTLSQTPSPSDGVDDYAADGTADSGANNRWRATMGPLPIFYPDRATADQTLLTYTSAPLENDLEITGEPVAQVFLSTADTDADVIVLLEEVAADGQVNYVTEGELRASHRADGAPPYRTQPPLHSHRRADAKAVAPGEPMRVDIALLPLSHVFKAGTRIRIALSGADRAQFTQSPVKALQWKVFRTSAMRSSVKLPVVQRK